MNFFFATKLLLINYLLLVVFNFFEVGNFVTSSHFYYFISAIFCLRILSYYDPQVLDKKWDLILYDIILFIIVLNFQTGLNFEFCYDFFSDLKFNKFEPFNLESVVIDTKDIELPKVEERNIIKKTLICSAVILAIYFGFF